MTQETLRSTQPFYIGPVRTAWRLLGRRGRDLKMSIALRFLQAMCAGIPVVFFVWVVDHLREGTLTTTHAWIATGVTVVAICVQFGIWYASNYYGWIGTFLAVGDARASTLGHVQRLPLGTLRSRSTGDVTANFTSDFEMVTQYVSEGIPALFGALGLPIFVVLAMTFIDAPLAAAVTLSLFAAGPLFIWVNNRFKALALVRGDRLAESSGRMLEYVQGITVARAFNRTNDRLSHYTRAVAAIRQINNRLVVRLLPLGVLTVGVVQLGVPLVIAITAYRWFGGAIDAGIVLIFLVLILRVYGPIVALAGQFEMLRLGDAALERIGRIMDLEAQAAPETLRAEPQGHDVEFEQVEFGYESTPILRDISFVARAGTTTAIVGPSGAGKSTILNLVSRFWDVDEGAVRIGGVDVRELTHQQLFEHITVVFQDVYLFRATVRENIAFGRPDATDAEIEKAARAAQAHEFIAELPQGYDTVVGEGGATLSGGERQRLSIARAVLKDSPIVLLDEPTSSLDALNDRAVRAALVNLLRNKTVLIVAHRLPTIQAADQILVVDSGQLVQRGIHEELMEQEDGRYYQLWLDRQRASGWRLGAHAAAGAGA
ncbi:MAG: ABC transporter ATP-binding protein [Caldilineaceae bacterium SB0661_bin_32]|uniref:ABC transporter ATP-binding protein n=1 Tax=Caldilineaceae bacterium SB0661_bin_32 TaxID=2605255 RepID=A0A6B1DEE5_9CHLR|nr:ABC transporter ATP-binding protein [Caldilineaceae bacterium SB0661_bin_32]